MSEPKQVVAGAARVTTSVATNLLKLAGMVIAIHEAFTTRNAVVLATAAFMMAGAQMSESFVLDLIDRVLGTPKAKTDESP